MEGSVQSKISKLRRSLSLTGVIVATAVGVLLPVILSSTVGIVALAMGNNSNWTLFGVLVVILAAAAIGGGIVVTVLLSKKHVIARQQADFLANVTHELRTPLTSIRMYTQTIAMGRLDGKPELMKQSVETILRETEWLEAMIDQVLTWRTASRDMDAPDMRTIPLQQTVQQSVERFQRMVSADEMSFTVEITSDAIVRHDSRAVESIVLNLLVNAYKYTSDPKKIVLRLKDVGDSVVLEVEDNGIGILETEFNKIFDPFYRVDSRLRGKASGAGLGLAIVKHNAALHGADVSVVSSEGNGAKFIVNFTVEQQKDAV